MDCVRKALLLSSLFALVFLLESEGVATDAGHRVVTEGAAGDDALQVVMLGLSLLQKEARREWKLALRILEKRAHEGARRNEEMAARLEVRHKDLEGRLSRLEGCVQRAVEECKPAETLPAPASTTTSSTHGNAFPASANKLVYTTTTDLGALLYDRVAYGNLEEVELLLDAGANPNYTYHDGQTPLMKASWNRHAHIVSLLVQRGANVHATLRSTGETALHIAAAYDRTGLCLPPIVAAGAHVDARDNTGQTPLHVAVEYSNEAALRVLLDAGASMRIKDDEGKTPVDIAPKEALRILLRL